MCINERIHLHTIVLIGIVSCAVVLMIAGTAAPGWIYDDTEFHPPQQPNNHGGITEIISEQGLFRWETTYHYADGTTTTTNTPYSNPDCENNPSTNHKCSARRAAAILAAIACCLAGISLCLLLSLFCVHHDHWLAILTYFMLFFTALIALLAWNVFLSVYYVGYAFYLFEVGFLLFFALSFWLLGGSHTRWSSTLEEVNTAATDKTDGGGRDAGHGQHAVVVNTSGNVQGQRAV